MTFGAKIPGPMGFYKAWPYNTFTPAPTEFGESLRDYFEEQGRKVTKQDAEKKAYELLSKAWKRWRRRYGGGDCMASCFRVARQFRYRGKWPNRYAPVKMFKHDKKWCKGNEHSEAIARYKNSFGDSLICGHLVIHQESSQGIPTKSVCYSLKPGMCVYTAEGYMQESKKVGKQKIKKWRWARRHMRMYIGKGEYRDTVNTSNSRHGGPVYTPPRTLYAVLGIWDPFAKNRASLFGKP